MASQAMENVTLAVLAGGKGRRMGVPKSGLVLRGQPILAYLLDRLTWQGPTLLVTTPGLERPPGHGRFDMEAVDEHAHRGPLQGVLTALRNAPTRHVVIVPVDMPLLDGRCVSWLAGQLLIHPEAHGVMLRHEGELQPLPAAFTRTLTDAVAKRLDEDRRALRGLADEDGVVVIDAPDFWPKAVWTNLNHPDDLDRFLIQAAHPAKRPRMK